LEPGVVGLHPRDKHLMHYEPSIDALSWEKRGTQCRKEFEAGKRPCAGDVECAVNALSRSRRIYLDTARQRCICVAALRAGLHRMINLDSYGQSLAALDVETSGWAVSR